MTKQELEAAEPLMGCVNTSEFKQRLQWLSEGMLKNHINAVINYKQDQAEVRLYLAYKGETK